MAADTQITGDFIVRAQKIVRLPDGGVAGATGIWSRCYAGLRWLADGEQGEPPKIKGATLLIAKADGSLWLAEHEFPAYPLLDKYTAVGAGAMAAMAAMNGGASAGDAVKAAVRLDAYTSDPIQMLKIEPKKKPARKR
ncbi:MAG: hypothetical protein HZT39_09760 [Pseudoxanthomonas sp.]|nr:MAG: hypothetical protein HZT39_09760 [Pseudoxanthomonas sp.]